MIRTVRLQDRGGVCVIFVFHIFLVLLNPNPFSTVAFRLGWQRSCVQLPVLDSDAANVNTKFVSFQIYFLRTFFFVKFFGFEFLHYVIHHLNGCHIA